MLSGTSIYIIPLNIINFIKYFIKKVILIIKIALINFIFEVHQSNLIFILHFHIYKPRVFGHCLDTLSKIPIAHKLITKEDPP